MKWSIGSKNLYICRLIFYLTQAKRHRFNAYLYYFLYHFTFHNLIMKNVISHMLYIQLNIDSHTKLLIHFFHLVVIIVINDLLWSIKQIVIRPYIYEQQHAENPVCTTHTCRTTQPYIYVYKNIDRLSLLWRAIGLRSEPAFLHHLFSFCIYRGTLHALHIQFVSFFLL